YNHDIQILVTDQAISDRIYYTCKYYVTKQQKQLDSQVAVAVATVKRRQECEALDAAGTSLETSNQVKARKRIAEMVYNVTNRQDVVLTTSDEHSFTLVTNNDNLEATNVRAISFLEDDIFRPVSLSRVNLYKFTMWRMMYAKYTKMYFHGFRVPLTDDGSQAKLCKRFVLSLVLFQPFRKLCYLIGVTTQRQRGRALPGVDGSDEDSTSNDDDFRGEDFDFGESDTLVEVNVIDESSLNVWDQEDDNHIFVERSALDPASCPTSATPDLKIVSMLRASSPRPQIEANTRSRLYKILLRALALNFDIISAGLELDLALDMVPGSCGSKPGARGPNWIPSETKALAKAWVMVPSFGTITHDGLGTRSCCACQLENF
ncbi:hypothetical protein JG687_00011878, partial [Phytophthora cactorum]